METKDIKAYVDEHYDGLEYIYVICLLVNRLEKVELLPEKWRKQSGQWTAPVNVGRNFCADELEATLEEE